MMCACVLLHCIVERRQFRCWFMTWTNTQSAPRVSLCLLSPVLFLSFSMLYAACHTAFSSHRMSSVTFPGQIFYFPYRGSNFRSATEPACLSWRSLMFSIDFWIPHIYTHSFLTTRESMFRKVWKDRLRTSYFHSKMDEGIHFLIHKNSFSSVHLVAYSSLPSLFPWQCIHPFAFSCRRSLLLHDRSDVFPLSFFALTFTLSRLERSRGFESSSIIGTDRSGRKEKRSRDAWSKWASRATRMQAAGNKSSSRFFLSHTMFCGLKSSILTGENARERKKPLPERMCVCEWEETKRKECRRHRVTPGNKNRDAKDAKLREGMACNGRILCS